MTMGAPSTAPGKLTHEQARMDQHLYWSEKTMPERLAAMTALTNRLYRMRGIEINERKTDSLLAAFLAARINCAVCGGVAVNVHG